MPVRSERREEEMLCNRSVGVHVPAGRERAGQERPLWWLSGDTSPVYNLEQDINTAILTRGGALQGLSVGVSKVKTTHWPEKLEWGGPC
jgi:hypothetical protein